MSFAGDRPVESFERATNRMLDGSFYFDTHIALAAVQYGKPLKTESIGALAEAQALLEKLGEDDPGMRFPVDTEARRTVALWEVIRHRAEGSPEEYAERLAELFGKAIAGDPIPEAELVEARQVFSDLGERGLQATVNAQESCWV